MKTYFFTNRSHTLIVEASSVSSARSALVFEVGTVRAARYQLVSVL
jgi:hypothetical protein